jgi:hypothetical protein
MKYGDSEWTRMADRRAVVQQARRKVADLNDWLISVRLERRRAPPRIIYKTNPNGLVNGEGPQTRRLQATHTLDGRVRRGAQRPHTHA